MKLNRINKFIGVAALLFAVEACDLTDIDPANRIPEGVAFSDAARIQAAVLGVYESAQRGFYLGAVQRGYPFGAASTEQNDMRGEDMYNDQLFYEITYIGNWTTTTANNNGMWISLYRVINRCNIVLEGIQRAETAGVLTPAQANAFRGEMLFLRAMSHFELVINYSRPYSDDPSDLGIPYRDFAVDDAGKVPAGIEVQRGTIQQTYTRILQDLDNAEGFLTNTGTPYRARAGAAVALKTRVKLHMLDWAGVITEYDKIDNLYALTASPAGPFTSGTSTEAIFSLQNSNVSNAGVNGALVSMYGSPTLGGRGLVKISPVIWIEPFWLASDSRRTLLTTQESTGVYSYKYRTFGVYDDPTPLIRHAEVVLNAAEAYARTNDFATAITLLNSVRNRAVGAALEYDLADLGGNQAGVLQGIWNERRIEFLGEGKRWYDVHRLSGEGLMAGIPAKAQTRSVSLLTQYTPGGFTLAHALPYTEDNFIWPIPLSEVLVNPTLADQQNPGY
ncbi:RagB/SusD family nutrient uptake outer membrane protein [Chryseotalea sanaruensis]|uniref:RagB/SusD family nutrient uptake outer membrane protein n=1 Tax=Chryseotalea sanaruensis TaxID=2482724 RepID=A0A401UCB7_9BACT|nr:RagB/SusD family nutrient uptake outer membrane protein [Chryseotalea sanaruensis]GCC52519.1 RagB/SusD family nutrient uptake outer membrane protein [Chryseotalea sanaruensis]